MVKLKNIFKNKNKKFKLKYKYKNQPKNDTQDLLANANANANANKNKNKNKNKEDIGSLAEESSNAASEFSCINSSLGYTSTTSDAERSSNGTGSGSGSGSTNYNETHSWETEGTDHSHSHPHSHHSHLPPNLEFTNSLTELESNRMNTCAAMPMPDVMPDMLKTMTEAFASLQLETKKNISKTGKNLDEAKHKTNVQLKAFSENVFSFMDINHPKTACSGDGTDDGTDGNGTDGDGTIVDDDDGDIGLGTETCTRMNQSSCDSFMPGTGRGVAETVASRMERQKEEWNKFSCTPLDIHGEDVPGGEVSQKKKVDDDDENHDAAFNDVIVYDENAVAFGGVSVIVYEDTKSTCSSIATGITEPEHVLRNAMAMVFEQKTLSVVSSLSPRARAKDENVNVNKNMDMDRNVNVNVGMKVDVDESQNVDNSEEPMSPMTIFSIVEDTNTPRVFKNRRTAAKSEDPNQNKLKGGQFQYQPTDMPPPPPPPARAKSEHIAAAIHAHAHNTRTANTRITVTSLMDEHRNPGATIAADTSTSTSTDTSTERDANANENIQSGNKSTRKKSSKKKRPSKKSLSKEDIDELVACVIQQSSSDSFVAPSASVAPSQPKTLASTWKESASASVAQSQPKPKPLASTWKQESDRSFGADWSTFETSPPIGKHVNRSSPVPVPMPVPVKEPRLKSSPRRGQEKKSTKKIASKKLEAAEQEIAFLKQLLEKKDRRDDMEAIYNITDETYGRDDASVGDVEDMEEMEEMEEMDEHVSSVSAAMRSNNVGKETAHVTVDNDMDDMDGDIPLITLANNKSKGTENDSFRVSAPTTPKRLARVPSASPSSLSARSRMPSTLNTIHEKGTRRSPKRAVSNTTTTPKPLNVQNGTGRSPARTLSNSKPTPKPLTIQNGTGHSPTRTLSNSKTTPKPLNVQNGPRRLPTRTLPNTTTTPKPLNIQNGTGRTRSLTNTKTTTKPLNIQNRTRSLSNTKTTPKPLNINADFEWAKFDTEDEENMDEMSLLSNELVSSPRRYGRGIRSPRRLASPR